MGSSSEKSSSSTKPWGQQQPYLIKGFQQAEQNVLDRPLEYFPGAGYVPFAPETEAALGSIAGRAEAGSPLLGGAQDYTQGVLSGDYLSPESNPFFSGAADAVMSQVQPAVAAQFGTAGRSGTSPLAAEALGRGVSRGLAPYMFGQYGQERGIQEAAAGRAPELAREDYTDPARLLAVGQERQGQSGRELADAMARHEFGQREPITRLAEYMQLIQGNYGGTTTSTTPGANPLLLGTGAALSLAGLPTQGGGSLGGDVIGK